MSLRSRFGITKAKFCYVNVNNGVADTNPQYYNVMINPSEISVSKSRKIKQRGGISKGKKDLVKSTFFERSIDYVRMKLYFDLVDENDKITHKAKGVVNAIRKRPGKSLDLNQNEDTCFLFIKNAAKTHKRVRFEWGQQRYEGYIVDFSANFNYFSEKGEAIRAEVDITLETGKLPIQEVVEKKVAEAVSGVTVLDKLPSFIDFGVPGK